MLQKLAPSMPVPAPDEPWRLDFWPCYFSQLLPSTAGGSQCQGGTPALALSPLQFLTLCALAQPGAYTDRNLLDLIELLCRAGLDTRLRLLPKTDLQQLLLQLLENIREWPGKVLRTPESKPKPPGLTCEAARARSWALAGPTLLQWSSPLLSRPPRRVGGWEVRVGGALPLEAQLCALCAPTAPAAVLRPESSV